MGIMGRAPGCGAGEAERSGQQQDRPLGTSILEHPGGRLQDYQLFLSFVRVGRPLHQRTFGLSSDDNLRRSGPCCLFNSCPRRVQSCRGLSESLAKPMAYVDHYSANLRYERGCWTGYAAVIGKEKLATSQSARNLRPPHPVLHCNGAALGSSLICNRRQGVFAMRGRKPDAASPAVLREQPWLIRTYAGHSTAAKSNALYRTNLAKGQTGLSIAFDLPTQTAYDADHELARGEVGKVGVPVGHLGDMRALFDQIKVEEMNTSMTINAPAAWLLSLYVALADEQGTDRKALTGT